MPKHSLFLLFQEFSKSPPVEPRLRHVFVFYTQVVCGILNSQELSEKLTGVVIPFMGEGLRGKFTDYRSSSLMILGIILTHCKLTAAVLKSFLLNLTKVSNFFGGFNKIFFFFFFPIMLLLKVPILVPCYFAFVEFENI